MSALLETSLTSMKASFPASPDPIQRIPTPASIIDMMLYICCCLQTQKTPASTKMNMLFCATLPGLSSRTTHTLQNIFRSQTKSIQSQISQHATQTMSARHYTLPTPVTKKQEQTSSP